MIHNLIIITLVLLGTTSAQPGLGISDCECDVPLGARIPCTLPFSSRFGARQQCLNAGCCYDGGSLFGSLFGSTLCYTRDSSFCNVQPLLPDNEPIIFPLQPQPQPSSFCQLATPLQPCAFPSSNRLLCEAQGCCFLANRSPSCFRKARTTLTLFTQPAASAQVSEWTFWSSCSDDCSPGFSTRTRRCLNADPQVCLNQGFGLSEQISCNQQLCQRWGSWKYRACSVTCGNGFNTRTRTCLSGHIQRAKDECYTSQTACNPRQCPVRTPRPQPRPRTAAWGQWQSWSICSQECARGQRTRSRSCIRSSRVVATRFCVPFAGSLSVSTQTESCNQEMCDSWTTWTAYSACGRTCGSAVRYSSRRCWNRRTTGRVSNAFLSCSQKEVACILPTCPSATTPSSFVTGTRFAERFRTTGTPTTPPRGNIFSITDPTARPTTTPSPTTTTTPMIQKSTTLATTKEPESPSIFVFTTTKRTPPPTTTTTTTTEPTTISTTTTSTTTTTTTTATTTTTTTPEPTTTTPELTTTTTTTTTTEATTTANPIVPKWGKWLDWSPCSTSCTNGTRIRTRLCMYSDGSEAGIEDCGSEMDSVDIGSCNDGFCQEWREWTTVEQCPPCKKTDEDVANKLEVKTRECAGREKKDADDDCYINVFNCEEIVTEYCSDETTLAAVVTEATSPTTEPSTTISTTTTSSAAPSALPDQTSIWADWGEWSSCSSECTPGIQSRARRCLDGVLPILCVEGSLDSRVCNEDFCYEWTEWDLGQCDVTCGEGGKEIKRRTCPGSKISESTPKKCYEIVQDCSFIFPCEDTTTTTRATTTTTQPTTPTKPVGKPDKKLDVLFLVDSSNYVDDCEEIEANFGLARPLRPNQINSTTAPNYTRMKKFITDFVNGWRGISDDGTRISIQLFSNLCSPRTKSNLYVEKQFKESHERVTKYIQDLPYMCGDYWLDWALQCAISPVLTSSFGDRKNVHNVVVTILSNAPTTSQPSDNLMRIILKRLVGKGSTVLSATSTPLDALAPKSRKRYEDNARKLACDNDEKCAGYLGSIWDADNTDVAELVRKALREAGEL